MEKHRTHHEDHVTRRTHRRPAYAAITISTMLAALGLSVGGMFFKNSQSRATIGDLTLHIGGNSIGYDTDIGRHSWDLVLNAKRMINVNGGFEVQNTGPAIVETNYSSTPPVQKIRPLFSFE